MPKKSFISGNLKCFPPPNSFLKSLNLVGRQNYSENKRKYQNMWHNENLVHFLTISTTNFNILKSLANDFIMWFFIEGSEGTMAVNINKFINSLFH